MKYPLVVTCPQPLLTAVCKYSSGTPLLPLVSAGFMCEDENPVCLCQGHVTSIWPSERGASLHLTWISQKEKKQISITEHIYVESRKIVWRRQWRPTPVLLPGKSHGQRSLVGGCPWGREESDMTGDFTFTFHFYALEQEMATYSSVLAWRIPGTGEPGGLPSMGSHRVGHDWSDLAAAAERVYRWSYLRSRNRDTDIENKCMDPKVELGVEWIGRLGLTHIHYCVQNR